MLRGQSIGSVSIRPMRRAYGLDHLVDAESSLEHPFPRPLPPMRLTSGTPFARGFDGGETLVEDLVIVLQAIVGIVE